jgi:hypothetical protein
MDLFTTLTIRLIQKNYAIIYFAYYMLYYCRYFKFNLSFYTFVIIF